MKKRIGRPPKSPEQKKEIQISVRITSTLQSALTRAATANGISFAAEVTSRLENSFGTNSYQRQLFGGPKSHAFSLLLALSLKRLRDLTGHAWHENAFTFEHAKVIGDYLFDKFRPRGNVILPKDLPSVKPGQVRRVKAGVPNEESDFGREAAEELFSAIMAFSGEYGRKRRELIQLLPEKEQKRYQFDNDLYSLLGHELMPLANRGKQRARPRQARKKPTALLPKI